MYNIILLYIPISNTVKSQLK